MTTTPSRRALALAASLVLGTGGSLSLLLASPAGAAPAPVPLGTAAAFAVLAGSTVTNTGPSVVNGDLGVSPGTAVTGFPPGVLNGTVHSADAVASLAQADTTTAYDNAAGRTTDVTVSSDLGGQSLAPGVYTGTTLSLTGTLTLDAGGDPSAVFILRSGSTLVTATDSRVALTGGASACNVFWQIGSSATLGTRTAFQGTLAALASITASTGTTVDGRLLARTAAVTLDTVVVTRPSCLALGSGGASPSASPTASPGTGPAASSAPSITTAPSGSPAASITAAPLVSVAPSVSAKPASPSLAPVVSTTPSASSVPVPGGGSVPGVVSGNGTPGGSGPGVVVANGTTGGSLGGTPGGAVPELPRTGADTGAAAELGLAAVLAGVLLVLAAHEPARGRHARPRTRLLARVLPH